MSDPSAPAIDPIDSDDRSDPWLVILSCGHVLCKSCMDQFVKGSGSCFVCSKKCADKDIIRLASSEGTGFASVGQAEAKKEGLGFQ